MKTLTRCLIGVILLAVATGCDKRDGKPSPNLPTGPSSYPIGLQLAGPDRISPGTTARLTAMVTKSDGSREDATARVKWSSDRPEVASVEADGRVSGRTPGTANILADFDGRFSGAQALIIVPANTFVLSGTVRQSSVPIADAKVEVVSAAAGAGMSLVTDAAGHFELFGVAGAVKLRVGKDDYAAAFRTFDMSRDRTVEVELEPSVELPDALTGTYSVTFSIAACADDNGFPPELRTRTYDATLTTEQDRVDVRLSGATFETYEGTGDHFSIWRTPGEFLVEINEDYSNLPDIHERLSADRTLAIYGTGNVIEKRGRLTGTLKGGFVTNPTLWWDMSTIPCRGQVAVSLVRK